MMENAYGNFVENLGKDFQFQNEYRYISTLSDRVVAQYSTDDLMGYGDINFDKGGETLQDQQRSQHFFLMEAYCEANDKKRICEIGTGNGDVQAYLAQKYKNHEFIGLDFSVTNANTKHKLKNLEFIKCYAQTYFQTLHPEQKIDLVTLASTTCLFTPLELEKYVELFAAKNVTDIIINEPSWAGLHAGGGYSFKSLHLDGSIWFHDYVKYFHAQGYETKALEIRSYTHPSSQRPDILLNLGHFQKISHAA